MSFDTSASGDTALLGYEENSPLSTQLSTPALSNLGTTQSQRPSALSSPEAAAWFSTVRNATTRQAIEDLFADGFASDFFRTNLQSVGYGSAGDDFSDRPYSANADQLTGVSIASTDNTDPLLSGGIEDIAGADTVSGQSLFFAQNDTRGTAQNLGTLNNVRTINGHVGTGDDNDFFRFNLSGTRSFNLSLTGMSADADVRLLNSSGQTIQSSTRAGSSSESISRTLNAGTYYAQVYRYRSASTRYSLRLSETPQDSAGNTRGAARNLGTLSGTRNFQDFVGTSDRNDYYRFSIDRRSDFDLSMTGLSADADVQLLDSDGQLIRSSLRSGSSSESITQLLDVGDYFVRVYPYTGNTNYTLNLDTTITQSDGAGNTRSAARDIGTLGSSQTFQDFVGTTDANDYYRFDLSQNSNFSLAMTELSADADVQLLNSSGQIIEGSYRENSLDESITRTLNAGAYYVRVFPFSTSNTSYALSVSASAASSPDGAGNTRSTARNIGTLSSSQTFQDFVGTNDTNDYYRFNLSESSTFNLALTGLSADADVRLLNSSGITIQSSLRSGSNSESITRALAAGTYYVQIYPFSGASTNYQLRVGASVTEGGFNNTYGYGLVNAATAVANALGQTTPLPNAPNLGGNNWGADMVNAPEAWAQGHTGDGIVVAVVDSGVDYSHIDLRDNIWVNTGEIANNGIDDDGNGFIDDTTGWDFSSNDNRPLDVEGHGTHVAGTIAATNNNTGVTGIAYGARIMPVRVLGDNGSGSSSDVAAGIRYAAANGADVINLSLGSSRPNSTIEAAIEYATEQGSFVVMASGNEYASETGYPARYATDYGIAVGAVDRNRQAADFSNDAGTDSSLQYVVAPGVDIVSTSPNNRYRPLSGTSMATPHVAGVVALMLSANADLTHAQIRQILTSSATALS